MTNDTQVFYAMRVNSVTGQLEPIGRAGTVEANVETAFKLILCPKTIVRSSGSTNAATSTLILRENTRCRATARNRQLAHAYPIVGPS
jgi:hypothetical protein